MVYEICAIRRTRRHAVEAIEPTIQYGAKMEWNDIEADEVDLAKTDLGDDAPNPAKPVVWEQWCASSSLSGKTQFSRIGRKRAIQFRMGLYQM